jgi:hypothetical protein
MKSWKELINDEMKRVGESFNDCEYCTLSEEDLSFEFDNGYGCIEGKEFTLWTKNRVYFPVQYDGYEWCRSVSRIIDKEPIEHIGGG